MPQQSVSVRSNNALNLTSGAGQDGRRSQVNAVFGEHQIGRHVAGESGATAKSG